MQHALHEEDNAMCVICYTLCGACILICLAVLIYVFLT